MIRSNTWIKVDVLSGEHPSKKKTVQYLQIRSEQEMVTRAYAILDGSSPIQAFPKGEFDEPSNSNHSDILGKRQADLSTTPATTKKTAPQTLAAAMEPARKLDLQPEPALAATAPPCSSTSTSTIGRASRPPVAANVGRKPSPAGPKKRQQAGAKEPKVRVGPARSALVKELKKAIRKAQFLATDLAAFTEGNEDTWGSPETVHAAAPMPADVARTLFFSVLGARGGVADGLALETKLYGGPACRALGVRPESLRGMLFAPPGMQLPPGQLSCWAIPRSEGEMLFRAIFERMRADAGIPIRGPRGGAVAGKPRRIGATTLILEELAVRSARPDSLVMPLRVDYRCIHALRCTICTSGTPALLVPNRARHFALRRAVSRAAAAAQVSYKGGVVSVTAQLLPGLRADERYHSSGDDPGLHSDDGAGSDCSF